MAIPKCYENTVSEYNSYRAAKYRCSSPNGSDWKYYGGRGIQFRFNSFTEFLNHLGLKFSPDLTLERINVNGHYEKGNVRWATRKEQSNNCRYRTTSRFLTIKGETLTLSEWSKKTGVKKTTINMRLNQYNFCPSCAVSLASGDKCPHKKFLKKLPNGLTLG